MILFEITTGLVGESYERCYVWTESEDDARTLFALKNSHREIKSITELLNDTEPEFITEISTEGWETGR